MREAAVDGAATKGAKKTGPGIPKITDPGRNSAILPLRIAPWGSGDVPRGWALTPYAKRGGIAIHRMGGR